LDIFIEPHLPKPQLVVVGTEPIARALMKLARTLSFHITAVDPVATRASLPEADDIVNELQLDTLPLRDEAFIVIASHGRFDEEALEQAAATSASYIALVASPKRAGVLLQHLRERGVPELTLERIKAPAGLNIGAEGAEEIALSILAEIVQVRRTPVERQTIVQEAPAEAVDPICKMSVVIEGARYFADHEGRRYYFCCENCKRTFERDPDRYAHVA
jgi:xanthine dehydrogenase accessory factor